MSAAGKIVTGFSLPYVAKYNASGGTITYSDGMRLARGVDVSITPETSDDNDFYADNVLAETESGKFTGGTLSLTVDGLLEAAERLINGLPKASGDWTDFGDSVEIPDVGVGFIIRYQSDGEVTYVPIVLVKCKFSLKEDGAATQEEQISWQTQALSAKIMRGDDANHSWKYLGKDYTTEAAAEDALKTKLNIQ